MDLNRSRDLGYQALERHEREQALVEQFDGPAARRPATWPANSWRPSPPPRVERAARPAIERE